MSAFLAGLLAAIAFGTVGGWIILVAAIIIIIALVENDHEIWAFFSLVTTVALLYHMRLSDFSGFVIHHPYQLAAWVLGYFAAGAGYGVIKWTSFVRDLVERYNDNKAEWLRTHVTVVPNSITTSEEAFAFKSTLSAQLSTPPQVRAHKGDILTWMTYWPFSGLWWLFSNPVRRIFQFIYSHMSGVMQHISDRMFKGVSADLELAKEAEAAQAAKRAAAEEEAVRRGVQYRR